MSERHLFIPALCLGFAIATVPQTIAADEPVADTPTVETGAEQVDPAELDRLGLAYWRGRGVEIDLVRAETLYAAAVDAGRTRALISLGRVRTELGDGRGALEAHRRAVDEGIEDADFWLARGHVSGSYGDVSDPAFGLAELERQSAAGMDRASYALADALDGGSAVTPDPMRALGLYQDLSDAGNLRAQERIGILLLRGVGGDPDPERAADILRSAVESGRDRALISLGRAQIAGGSGREALSTFEEAVARGVDGADFWLARGHARQSYGRLSDQELGRGMLEALAAAGDLRATLEFARLIGRNEMPGADVGIVVQQLEEASAAGNGRATEGLIRLLREYRRAVADPVGTRARLLEERGDDLRQDRRLAEEVYLAAERTQGNTRYRTVSGLLAGATTQEAFVNALRAAYSSDRRAYTWVLQEALAERGYYEGPVNGWMTQNTIRAFRRLCRDAGVDDICMHGPLRSATVSAVAPLIARTDDIR